MEIFAKLLHDFNRSSTWTELALLLACLALAYLASRAAGRSQPPHSIWFGRRTVDGLMFPLVALVLVVAARTVMVQFQPVFLLRLAVPLLVSLVLIRFLVRVLGRVFPDSGLVRLAERVASLPDLGAATLFAAIRDEARQAWRAQRFFRLLNRMLFLAGSADKRWTVMQRFYRLPAPLIARFYAGRLRLADKARVLTGKPPVPVRQAMAAACKIHPNQIRNPE